MSHQPVLLHEVLEGLVPAEGNIVLDATVGNGGHAVELCRAIGKRGYLVGLDNDEAALKVADRQLSGCSCRYTLFQKNFRHLDEALHNAGLEGVDRILFDLGLRSELLEMSGRGFSLRRDEPLVMTFDSSPSADTRTAKDIVNTWNREDLIYILSEYGEERFARRIAEHIVATRRKSPIRSTYELVSVVESAIPPRFRRGRLHYATKTFQAIRMAVNDEINTLQEGISKACNVLSIGGRIAVISFHSVEDRIVKNFFKKQDDNGEFRRITKKPIVPGDEERINNPRARSAKLRIIEKRGE